MVGLLTCVLETRYRPSMTTKDDLRLIRVLTSDPIPVTLSDQGVKFRECRVQSLSSLNRNFQWHSVWFDDTKTSTPNYRDLTPDTSPIVETCPDRPDHQPFGRRTYRRWKNVLDPSRGLDFLTPDTKIF